MNVFPFLRTVVVVGFGLMAPAGVYCAGLAFTLRDLIQERLGRRAVIIGILTARPLLGGFEQAFQFIQEFTGFFTPGITVIILLGLFWKRANADGERKKADQRHVATNRTKRRNHRVNQSHSGPIPVKNNPNHEKT